jgi:hypothetical protein
MLKMLKMKTKQEFQSQCYYHDEHFTLFLIYCWIWNSYFFRIQGVEIVEPSFTILHLPKRPEISGENFPWGIT